MKDKSFKRKIAIFFLIIFINSIIAPGLLLAGQDPTSPDFSGFESSSTRQMVSEFTGDFTYNLPVIEIPGPDGSGYSLSLSYHSGTSPDEDASWVGYGFSLSPGAINRNVRGYPDDYKNEPVIMHNKTPKNWTATANVNANLEVFSLDLGLNASAGLRYNNYSGFGYNLGAGLSYNKGVVSLGYNVSDGEGSFSLSVNPAANLGMLKSDNKKVKKLGKFIKDNSRISLVGSNYGLLSFSDAARPFSVHSYHGFSQNFSVGIELNPAPAPIGVNAGIFGSYSEQENDEPLNLNAFGFLYSAEATGDNALMDYSLEKETPYNKRDVFLGIPFNNADNYVVSGEGIGGGFRLYHKNIGQFKPNYVESGIVISNIGGDLDAGLNFGGGLDLGAGKQTLKVQGWDNSLSTFSSLSDDTDEPVYFRFTYDLGGFWDHFSGDEPIAASMTGGGAPGFKSYSPSIAGITTEMNLGKRSGRSSYIDFNLNKAFGNSHKIHTNYSLPGLDRTIAPDGVGEFAVTNENGQKYVYGLPVYSKNEKNLKIGVVGASGADIDNNYLVYYKNNDVLVGEEKSSPYATAYLLTTIYSPDYIDRTNDGPTSDDLGGYTKFNYVKVYGANSSSGKNFKWRTPYNGLLYDRGSLSDQLDDVGTVSQGEKEVYYLQSVETKTHVAIFTTTQRQDGYDADFSGDPITSRNIRGANNTLKLDRIDLYSKKDIIYSNGVWEANSAKPIKTVRFWYSYRLCANVPNSQGGFGKLTLEKVWFEYNGITPRKISPYEFQYEYPFSRPDFHYPPKYSYIEEEFSGYSSGTNSDQNPDYSPFNLDPWGYYQKDGATRFNAMNTWVNQTPPANFDPAAWQLKVIKLPTGGEIHIQYEQDDYKYVQDKVAHVMVKAEHSLSGLIDEQTSFIINPEDIGITADNDKEALAKLINKLYVNGGENGDKKMYFKFLYRLLGVNEPQLNECNSDFITGYAFVKNVTYNNVSKQIVIELGNGADKKTLPHYTCRDFVLSQRAGKLIPFGNCDPNISGIQNPDPATIVNQLIGFATTLSFPGGVCPSLSNDYSYLRIPVLHAKKGGGLRVKRLLMYDNNMGNPVLYGNEYMYKLEDNTSSGVATNEPGSNREENILVDYIKRGDQNLFSKIVAGRDKKQSEGPIGESVLPGPSVGYSKVYTRNIHSGKTGTGFAIKEFYTARDFPFQAKYSDINTHNDYMIYPLMLYNSMTNNLWATQGFSFIRNDMHGQVKRDATYSGELANDLTQNGAGLVSEQVYEYFKPGESIPVSASYGSAVKYLNCGKEVDVTFAGKTVKDVNDDINVEVDLTAGIWGIIPIPFFGAAPSYTRSVMELSAHATTKVINYPPIVKKLTTFNEGSYHTVENIAFDESTGKPVTTKSYDEFSGTYMIQNIPGSWEYKNLQQKAINEGMVFKNIFSYQRIGSDEFIAPAAADCDLKNNLIPGDLIDIDNGNIYHVQEYDNLYNRFKIVKSLLSAVSGDPQSNIAQLVILRSGRLNKLNENIGSFTLHSQDENIAMPLETASDRWEGGEANPFINALNIHINGLAAGTGTFTINSQYDHINIEAFISEISGECANNLRDASIRNIEVLYNKSEYIQLKIISLELFCNGAWVKVEGKK